MDTHFATRASSEIGREERVILPVCTRALLVGAKGAVGGLTLTTHHLAHNLLRQVCENAALGAEAVYIIRDNI